MTMVRSFFLLLSIMTILAVQPVPAQTVHVLDAHTSTVYTAKFSPDGQHIVTGGDDHRAYLWSAVTGAQEHLLQVHTGYIADAVFSSDGTQVATASADATAGLWETASGNLLRILYGHEATINSIRFNADGSRIVTASQDNTAKVWNTATAAVTANLQGHTGAVETAVFSPDNTRIATGSMDGTAGVWDAVSGERLATLVPTPTGLIDIVYRVEFSPDGARLLTSQSNDSSTVWDISSESFRYSVPGRMARFSPDGSVLTAVAQDKIAVYDAATGAELYSMPADGNYPARSIAYTATNRPLAAVAGHASLGTWDVRIIDVQNKQTLKTLEGHTDYVYAVEFSPDRNNVVTASRDATARLWLNAATTDVREESGSNAALICSYIAATGTVRASAAGTIHNVTFSLYNSLGIEVDRLPGNGAGTRTTVTFEASRLPAGMYFVRLTGEAVNTARPVFITR